MPTLQEFFAAYTTEERQRIQPRREARFIRTEGDHFEIEIPSVKEYRLSHVELKRLLFRRLDQKDKKINDAGFLRVDENGGVDIFGRSDGLDIGKDVSPERDVSFEAIRIYLREHGLEGIYRVVKRQ